MEEIWKPVSDVDGYEVSNLGRVRSIPRLVNVAGGGQRLAPSKMLKPWRSSDNGNRAGHLTVSLGRGIRCRVHHLVLEEFVGPRPPGMLALHRDGDSSNNTVENLYWGTYSENMHDSVKHGVHAGANKEVCDKGHPLDRVKTLASGSKRRYCSTCQREWKRNYRAALKDGTVRKRGRPRKSV